MDQNARRLVYFADPMCSWCYGFAPVVAALARHFGSRLPIDIVMGGLRPGTTQPMSAADKDYVRSAWTRVAAASGQAFDFAFFDRERFVYDTEPACRAVVTMRRLRPELALDFEERVARAFYAENRDVTQASELTAIAAEAGLDADGFATEFHSPAARSETMRGFLTAQELGIRGFPTLIVGSEGDGYALLTNGYRPLDGLIGALENWLVGETTPPQVKLETPVKK